ncbi:vitamin B12 dependent methionine synthase [Desulfomonile tiedjei]|uniref:Vitamin B12 dependent methionine synthase n=1 Tax=Desulfomonile tiedjei (strain ATCC 49306 / DSM 6799 / DCB-1) TaxID=706587 RepID=I4CET7_DESTA|nr:vitamin B12 dependent methionine synthase [Desulfomonile tiedjei]AFM28078.1 vitamin B12 dependent methionine synthase [Desulfomonile tiedjei DSM 6799]
MDDIDKAIERLCEIRIFGDLSVHLDRDEMLRRTGMTGRKRPVAPILLAEFDKIAGEVQSGTLIRARAVTRVLQILEVSPNQVVLAGGITLCGTLLQRKAPDATHIGLAICTIGEQLEEAAVKYRQKDLLKSLILDGIGSAAVDSLAAEVSQLLCSHAAGANLTAGGPLFFGTPGLPIQNLGLLFQVLPAEEIGVKLTSSYFMLPQKTSAFVVGIGPAMPAWSKEQSCRQCALHRMCRYRV